ncbi:hypothetical protein [Acidovorax sp. MR-S7]|uniref:hypothetical protein n=1 Tax=Acidovorax sp. MR-S7 TaxID=1268622 RepID=UPI00035E56BE|nr:hypothetical protein [Acidovorax sp. MR-S7]GAD20902.1 hypothetical protein AVS7_00663 [Acidovorax sp. MR-S7]
MALSDPEINLLRLKSRDPFHFARAIEAEFRKQDDALILQLVEALEYHRAQTRPIERTDEAITAGRARLEGKP